MGGGEGARWSVRLRLVAGGSEVADRDRQRAWPRAAKILADSIEIEPDIDEQLVVCWLATAPASHDEKGRGDLVGGRGTGCLARHSHIHVALGSHGAAIDAEASIDAVADGVDWWVTPPRRGRAILCIVHARAARPARFCLQSYSWRRRRNLQPQFRQNRNHPRFSSRGAALALDRHRAVLLSTGVRGRRRRRKSDNPCDTGLATLVWLVRQGKRA